MYDLMSMPSELFTSIEQERVLAPRRTLELIYKTARQEYPQTITQIENYSERVQQKSAMYLADVEREPCHLCILR